MGLFSRLFKDSGSTFDQAGTKSPNIVLDRDTAQKLKGNIVIPGDVVEIKARSFDGNKAITSVTVPGTVKRIGSRAFADCDNLEKVTLCEGIEAIDTNVFTGCKKLRQVTYPDSVTQYQGWTFYGSELSAPVFNHSKTLLVFCPKSVSGREWTVPDSVKIIGWQAFIENTELEILHLPEGLEKIEEDALIECGIREITIPYSVREIGKTAFDHCTQLEKVTILNPATKLMPCVFDGCVSIKEICVGGEKIRENDRFFHLKGKPFLMQHLEDAANLRHRADPRFKELTARCARGDDNARSELAGFFEEWAERKGASRFYLRAANYWRYRAYQAGNKQAEKWFNRFFDEHPSEHLESILCENSDHLVNWYTYSFPGEMLNDLGYDFFEPHRKYEIKQYTDTDVVEVSAFESYEGPDEDGYGAETYYDWWFLDENMQPIPGVLMVNDTTHERNSGSQYSIERAKAEKILKKRKNKR